MRDCRFVWLGTDKLFDAFTFAFEETECGWFQAHAYRFDDHTSTFIVETPERVWRAAGLDEMSKEDSIAFCERLFATLSRRPPADVERRASARLGAVDPLPARRLNENWVHYRRRADGRHDADRADGRRGAHRALLDRLGHQARARRRDRTGEQHRARIRAISTARCSTTAMCAASRCCASRMRRATRPSGSRTCDRYASFEPEQFAYSLLTRWQRISHENLRVRDAAYLADFEDWIAQRSGIDVTADTKRPVPPMFTPFTLRGVTLKNRIVVSPMAQYSAVDGIAGRLSPGAPRRPRDGRRRRWS